MLLKLKHILFVLLLANSLLAQLPTVADGPAYGADSVVVVANKSMPGSLKVAQAYMKMREIPDNHLIVLESSTEEHISRREYLETIHNPIIR